MGEGVSRRSFLKTAGASAAVASLSHAGGAALGAPEGAPPDATPALGPDPVDVTLSVNGKPMKLRLDPATTLLSALRMQCDLTGAKEACDRASCGACSVIVDGRLIASCMMLALDAQDAKITTVEGLANGDTLDPLQTAFVKHDALQCGFCTPGLVVACRVLLDNNPKPTLAQVKSGLSGNICRCGTYTNIFNAVLEASGQSPIADSAPV